MFCSIHLIFHSFFGDVIPLGIKIALLRRIAVDPRLRLADHRRLLTTAEGRKELTCAMSFGGPGGRQISVKPSPYVLQTFLLDRSVWLMKTQARERLISS